MKVFVKLLPVLIIAAPSILRADNNDREYLINLPRSQTFTYDSLDSSTEVSLTFAPATTQLTTPTELRFEDLINHVDEVELFDRLSLLQTSELRVGTRTYPLQCMRVHGSGLASDESDLRFVELFFPLDDPDGQCVGPLNPDYPTSGADRYRWHKYLTVVWNGQEKRIVDAELYFDGITYNLTVN